MAPRSQFWRQDAGGMRYLLDVEQGLLETVDRNGNRTTYGPDGIVPDRGIGVDVRDGLGRMSRMDLPDGSAITYGYDGSGDLVSVVDTEGDEVQFVYDSEHRLVSFNDAGRGPVAVLEYDADGLLVGQTDPLGVFVETSSDPDGWSQTVVGPDPALETTTYFNSSRS